MTQMNLAMKQKQAHRHRADLRAAGGGEGGRGMDWGFGGQQMQTIIHTVDEQQVLLCSTGIIFSIL